MNNNAEAHFVCVYCCFQTTVYTNDKLSEVPLLLLKVYTLVFAQKTLISVSSKIIRVLTNRTLFVTLQSDSIVKAKVKFLYY